MDPRQRKQQRLIIASVLAVAGIVIILIFTLGHKNSSPGSSSGLHKTTTSYDANSGETTRTIQGENNSGVASNYPTFLGESALLNRGLTTDQLTNMQTAFLHYSVLSKLNFKQVSISVNNIQTSTINPDTNPIQVMNFPVVFDNKTTAYATLQYSGLSNTELILKDKSGQQLYDSGVITASSSN